MQIWKMGRKKLKFTRIEKNGRHWSANHLKKAERLESTTALFCIYASGTEKSMHISKQSINICRAGGFS